MKVSQGKPISFPQSAAASRSQLLVLITFGEDGNCLGYTSKSLV